MRSFSTLGTSRPTVSSCVHSTQSSMRYRRHSRGCLGGLHLLAHSSIEDITFQQIHGGVCLQLPATTNHHHRLPPSLLQLQQPDNQLHLLRKSLRHPHADPSQLFINIRHYPEPSSHHQQSQYPLRRHGGIDHHRLQLQLQFRIHVSISSAERQQSQKPPTQQHQQHLPHASSEKTLFETKGQRPQRKERQRQWQWQWKPGSMGRHA